MAAESELDRLDPEPVPVKLASGFPVEVVRLKTRQMFRLLRILTRGAGPAIQQLNFAGDAEAFGQRVLGVLIMAFPDAEQETILFLQSMCRPEGLASTHKNAAQLSKKENEADQALWDRFNEELFNPEIEDTLALLEAIVETEAGDLQALGKKLAHLWKTVQNATGWGKAKEDETPVGNEELNSAASTASSSTSSQAATDGPTTKSSTSPSAGSGSARRRRAVAATTSS